MPYQYLTAILGPFPQAKKRTGIHKQQSFLTILLQTYLHAVNDVFRQEALKSNLFLQKLKIGLLVQGHLWHIFKEPPTHTHKHTHHLYIQRILQKYLFKGRE